MTSHTRNALAFSASLIFGSLIGFATTVFAAKQQEPISSILPLNDLRTFVEVLDQIKNAYVEPVEDSELLENAIKGMLSGLDPHSAYLEPESFKDLQVSTTGEFGGLGIEVGTEDGYVKVITPIDDTPAQKAGIQAGDLIIKLDNKSVQGMSLNEAVQIMRGKPGTDILLTIIREGENQPLEIKITRDVITVKSIKTRPLDADYGYVRISQFQINTGKDIVDAIEKLAKEQKSLKGIVLDLRNNPGGILQSAVEVADAFLTDGLIVYTKGRLPNSDLKFSATPEQILKDTPIVVLVNGGSASASEIVAGALQDHKRAIIMGTSTFGKGSVQTVLPITNDRGLKLTTALYYTPNGRSIQAEGIKPDIEVGIGKLTRAPTRDMFKEADLARHLESDNPKDKAPEVKEVKPEEQQKDLKNQSFEEMSLEDILAVDYQLNEALNLLKALNVLSHYAKPAEGRL